MGYLSGLYSASRALSLHQKETKALQQNFSIFTLPEFYNKSFPPSIGLLVHQQHRFLRSANGNHSSLLLYITFLTFSGTHTGIIAIREGVGVYLKKRMYCSILMTQRTEEFIPSQVN